MSFIYKPVYSTEKKEYIVKYKTTTGLDIKFFDDIENIDYIEPISVIGTYGDGYLWILIETDQPEKVLEIENVESISENRKAYAC